MLPWLNCTVTLGKSKNFARLALLIYLAATWMLLTSGLLLFIKVVLCLLVIAMILLILAHPYPEPAYRALHYYQESWHLDDKRGKTATYTQHRVLLEAGVFFLLELRSTSQRKVLIIFFDQLAHEQYRMLRVLQRIN